MIDDALFSQLLHTLIKINFSYKYYSFYENTTNQISQINDKKKFDKQDFNEILIATGLNFKYQSKEIFFVYEENQSDYNLILKYHLASLI